MLTPSRVDANVPVTCGATVPAAARVTPARVALKLPTLVIVPLAAIDTPLSVLANVPVTASPTVPVAASETPPRVEAKTPGFSTMPAAASTTPSKVLAKVPDGAAAPPASKYSGCTIGENICHGLPDKSRPLPTGRFITWNRLTDPINGNTRPVSYPSPIVLMVRSTVGNAVVVPTNLPSWYRDAARDPLPAGRTNTYVCIFVVSTLLKSKSFPRRTRTPLEPLNSHTKLLVLPGPTAPATMAFAEPDGTLPATKIIVSPLVRSYVLLGTGM